MKKHSILILVLTLAILFSGCDAWFVGSYYSVNPHQEFREDAAQESVEITSTTQLQRVLTELVADGRETGVIYVTEIDDESLKPALTLAIRNVRQYDPIGAFAVDDIDYEIGTSTGRTAIAVNISYSRSRSEILRIKTAKDMDAVMTQIAEALDDCDASVVVKVDAYEDMDFTQRVQDYVDTNPATCMEMPMVSASVYPESGDVRVIELTFTYQTSRDALRSMQTYVYPVFRAADLNVSGEEEESVKFSRMYAFLMERNDYQLMTSITPAYSLLRHGVGDSKAFATVYAAMCRSSGLECQVISGTRAGEPWTWNLICQDGRYYHVDLMRSNDAGELLLWTQEDMGEYVWDYSAYPVAEDPVSQITQPTEEGTQPMETDPVSAEETVEPVEETTQPASTEPETTAETLPQE